VKVLIDQTLASTHVMQVWNSK